MRSIRKQGVEDARKNLPALLEQAHRGQTLVVTKRGKPYAAIVPVDQVVHKKPGMSLTTLRGSGKGMWGKDSTAWLKKLRKEW
jgi:prevent-host-death family protein